MNEPVQEYIIQGTIGDVEFADYNIKKDSLSIVNQCSGNQEISLGSVYVGELSAVFEDINIPRYAWKGKEITLSMGLKLIDGVYELVPLGVYIIQEAVYGSDGVSVTAYDRMSQFDKTAKFSFTNGTPFELISYACEACGVPLGMTESEIKLMPNGTGILGLYATNDIDTWRDFLYWLSQTLCAFATMDREGKLKLVNYTNTISDTVDSRHRFHGAGFSDYESTYTGVYLTRADDNTMKYYGAEEDTGLTLSLGANPFIQYGTDESREIICNNIVAGLSAIKYVPYQAEMLPSAAVYDLGDVICFSEGLADGDKLYCINKMEFSYKNKCSLTGVGKNPALASAKSKTDKNLQGIAAGMNSEELQFYEYINTKDITIADMERKQIISIRALTNSDAKAQFNAEVLCSVTCDSSIEITVEYERDNVVVDYKPIETWINGRHILSLFFMIDLAENTATQWDVYLTASGGSVDIAKGSARAVIYGQGLATTAEWDGTITVEENIGLIDISGNMEIVPFEANAVVKLYNPEKASILETVGLFDIGGSLDVIPFNDMLFMNKSGASHETWSDMNAYTWDETKEGYIWI